jgi:hypothetical protein
MTTREDEEMHNSFVEESHKKIILQWTRKQTARRINWIRV